MARAVEDLMAAPEARTADAKAAGNRVVLVGYSSPLLGGSHYLRVHGLPQADEQGVCDDTVPDVERIEVRHGEHRLEISAIVRYQCEERRIASRRVRQFGDIGLQRFPVAVSREILKIDGNFRLKRVYGAASAFSGARSALPDTRCGDGVGRVRHG